MNTAATIQSIPTNATLAAILEAERVSETMRHPVSQIRPWVRYFARIVDLFLFSGLAGATLGLFAPSVLDIPGAFFSIIVLFVWIFQEAILLANCGTTPGKWLFKIRVRNGEGQKLTFSEALNRSFSVWIKGMGAGVPLLSLITLLGSRSKLKSDGVTAWDEDGGFLVTHSKIGILRSAVAAMLLAGLFSLGAWGSAMEETEDFTFASDSFASEELFAEPSDGVVTGGFGTYSIQYDPSTWVAREAISNPDAEYEFHHGNGDAYAVLIYERTPLPLTVLAAVVIENAQSVASDVRLVASETIQLGDESIISLQFEATVMTVPLVYNAYLSSGEHGTLQFITYTSKYLFDDYRYDCHTLLRGLSLTGYESKRPNDTNPVMTNLEHEESAIEDRDARNDVNRAGLNDLIDFADKWLDN